METHAVFEIQVKENGEIAFNKLAAGGKKFEEQAHKTKAAANELTTAFDSLKNTMLAGVGIFAAVDFAKSSENIYLGVQRADAEIKASLKSTGEAAGVTNDQLQESFEKLYHSSTYTAEQLKQMQAMVLTFPKVTKDNFNEAEQAIVDMAAKFKETDLQGFAVRVSKALQDPATGMTMLRREGVNFTKAQTEMVKHMVDSGHLAEAQKYIMHELATEFAGSAQAALDAGGAHAQLGKTIEELQLETGKLVSELEADLVPALTVVIKDIQDGIKWGEKHKGVIEGTAKVVGVLVTAYIAYTTAVKLSTAADFLFGTSLAELTIGMRAEAAAATEAAEATTALTTAMDLNPIGLAAAAIGGLAAAYLLLADNSKQATQEELHNQRVADIIAKQKDLQGHTWDPNTGKIGDKPELTREQVAISQYGDIDAALKGVRADLAMQSHKKKTDKVKDDAPFILAAISGDKELIAGLLQYKQNKKDLQKDLGDFGSTKTDGGGGSTATVPSPDGKESSKQVINTWNVKTFADMKVINGGTKEAKDDIYDHVMGALTMAQRDSEIASTET